MQNRFALLVCLLLAFVAGSASFAQSTVRINEFIASNGSSVANMLDENGDASDWIELYNSAATAVNISGWRLTDDADTMAKWTFPAGASVPARGYLLVYASSKDRTSPRLHANFSLAADGEYLALSTATGEIVSEFEFGAQIENVSYGYDATGALRYFTTPTPGTVNGTGFVDVVDGPKFSVKRGFYDTPFTVTLQSDTPQSVIRYTTNGVQPTATIGTIYSGPIQISGTTVLRAVAYRTGWQASQSETHTYLFVSDIIRQPTSAAGAAAMGWPTTWGGNIVNYGMDPSIVDSPRWGPEMTNALKALPSYSVVMALSDMFSSQNGIYANPGQDGRTWERPCSVELIHPDGTQGFQKNAGIRIRGGYSRSTNNPKHALRLFFRDEYSAGKLEYPVFGPDAAQEFENFDLRTFQNYSWSFEGDTRGHFMRDVFSRDTQLAMGRPAERGDYVHLYINGFYWGIYNTAERPEASYGEAYFGGNKDDFDVVKVEAGSYDINATDGNLNAWRQLYDQSKLGYPNDNTAYFRIQGKNPDGTINTNYPVLVDMPNLIDYMLVILYGGNLDAPISNFLGNQQPNNWYGLRDRLARDGFRFIAHDSEHTMLDINADRTGPYTAGENNFLDSNPQWVWQKLQANAEFRLLVADHVHRHFFNDGVMTSETALARLQRRINELSSPVIAESARWGDSKRTPALTRDNWISAVSTATNFVTRRGAIVLNQMRADQLYPALVAPTFSRHGGAIPSGFNLTMTAPAGTIYYTTDGTDPRMIGGGIRPGARAYSSAVRLTENSQVKSRVRTTAGEWSALNEANFILVQTFTELVISEIMYHAADEGTTSGDDLDFIELKNTSSRELDISGVHFSTGIDYTFPNGTRLGPGQFVVLVEDAEAFAAKYPNVRIDGVYTGQLSNSGETLTLSHAAGGVVGAVAYLDRAPWPLSADGSGFSLTLTNPNVAATPGAAAAWRASARIGGSPGADDLLPNLPTVWVTEILTHTDAPALDTVELHNPGTTAADISGWFLTDSRSAPNKFRLPSGTVIPPGGYVTFTEAQFNAATEPSRFTFSSHGEEAYLFSADAAGNLTGFSDGFAFGAAANGVTFGRHVTSASEIYYPAQRASTLGGANSGPAIGPVIINELRYSNARAAEEFIEIKNISESVVSLFDPANPGNTWKINGVDFDFPTNVRLQPGELAVVINSDPSAFRSRYAIPANIQVFGPFAGNLQDGGENVQLLRPDAPDTTPEGVVVPYIVVDEVRYDDAAPWPVNVLDPDFSLERLSASSYGNDPLSWRSSIQSVSPGFNNDANRPPRINAGPDIQISGATFPLGANLTGIVLDDGQPTPANLAVRWSFVSGPGPVRFVSPTTASTTAFFPGSGIYTLKLTADDGALSTSDEVVVQVARPTVSSVILPARSVWKYLDDGSNQQTAWQLAGFNDSAWTSGPGILGYSDSPNTTLGYGPDANNKYITYYFRRMITVQSAAGVQALKARLMRDDGAVIYINGREVMRSNMPEGTISFTTRASGAVDQSSERTYFEQDIDHTTLVDGQNIIAVEIHQTGGNSSDLTFDLELVASMYPPNSPPTVNAGADQTITLPAAATLSAIVSDDALPLPPGVLTLDWTKSSGPGDVTFSDRTLSVTSATFTQPGNYVLRLTGRDGIATVHDEVSIMVQGNVTSPFDQWREQNFTAAELQNAAISGPNSDPDLDGHTNEQEFVAGTNPKDVASVLKIAAELSETGATLRVNAVAGKSYTIQGRDSLTGGAWVRIADIDATTNGIIERNDTSGNATRFYRVLTPKAP